eukprot:3713005-Pyramimonas_sp.AAC.1
MVMMMATTRTMMDIMTTMMTTMMTMIQKQVESVESENPALNQARLKSATRGILLKSSIQGIRLQAPANRDPS